MKTIEIYKNGRKVKKIKAHPWILHTLKNVDRCMAQCREWHHCHHHHRLSSGGWCSKGRMLTVICLSWLAVLVAYPITLQMMQPLKWRNVTFMGWKGALLSQQCSVGKRDYNGAGWNRLFANGINRKLFVVCHLCNVRKLVGGLRMGLTLQIISSQPSGLSASTLLTDLLSRKCVAFTGQREGSAKSK